MKPEEIKRISQTLWNRIKNADSETALEVIGNIMTVVNDSKFSTPTIPIFHKHDLLDLLNFVDRKLFQDGKGIRKYTNGKCPTNSEIISDWIFEKEQDVKQKTQN